MKTAHQLARDLLAGPDLPIYHFDPSRAGLDDEDDTSISEPKIERETLDADDGEGAKERAEELGKTLLTDFLTICGDTDESGEAVSFRESNLKRGLEEEVLKLRIDRTALAKLASETPQFFNPLHVAEAKRLRDRVLSGEA